MSDAVVLPQTGESEPKRTPTVYFIDDSATMREVIKIAFRRENISVITCPDATSALSQFEENPPDVVITDVIMPDTDGYSVCSQVKQNPQFAKTPVILMSGVVNKSVADRAVAVQADELVRKPFQPQELITRVKNLIGHGTSAAPQPSVAFKPVHPTSRPARRAASAGGYPARARTGTTANNRGSLAAGRDRRVHASTRPCSSTGRRAPSSACRPAALCGNRFRDPETASRSFSPRTPNQKTPDRAPNRAPIQPSSRAPRPHPNPSRIAPFFTSHFPDSCV